MDKLKLKEIDTAAVAYRRSGNSNIRAMTYNIHSCVNMDGKVRPERIAGVIDELSPDVVALQEVDASIPRTHRQYQAKIIGEMLGMDFRFFPVVKNGTVPVKHRRGLSGIVWLWKTISTGRMTVH